MYAMERHRSIVDPQYTIGVFRILILTAHIIRTHRNFVKQRLGNTVRHRKFVFNCKVSVRNFFLSVFSDYQSVDIPLTLASKLASILACRAVHSIQSPELAPDVSNRDYTADHKDLPEAS